VSARRVLVTGAAGFLGGAVADALLTKPGVELVVGTDVRAMADRPGPWVAVERDIAAGVGDVLAEHDIDAVVHHAFEIRPPRDPAAAAEANVIATARLVEEAAAAGVSRIVYPSSTTVYGARAGSEPHTEDEPPRPMPGFTYSEQKVEAEEALTAGERAGGLSVVILRACVVAGPGAVGFILESLSLRVLPLVAGADPGMQFLHIDDYTAAIEAALATHRPGIYNLAGHGTVRPREMAAVLGSRVVSLPGTVLRGVIRWTWRLRLQGRSPEAGLAFITHPWTASIEKAEWELGWMPRHSSRDAIAAWAEWRRGG
jgi:UDP-glucose 4-epimerase